MFNRAADIAQSDLVNSRTFKDLWNEIQGLSSTCSVFKYFQGLEFRRKKFKYLKDAWEPCFKVEKSARKSQTHYVSNQRDSELAVTRSETRVKERTDRVKRQLFRWRIKVTLVKKSLSGSLFQTILTYASSDNLS